VHAPTDLDVLAKFICVDGAGSDYAMTRAKITIGEQAFPVDTPSKRSIYP
jgi:hypothetical protein